jgi:hypothetical protein
VEQPACPPVMAHRRRTQSHLIGLRQVTRSSTSLLLAAIAAVLFIACGTESASVTVASPTPGSNANPDPDMTPTTAVATPTPSPTPSPPTATPTPAFKYPDMALELKQGEFWDLRWESTDQSCSQGRGCSTSNGAGTFRGSLGAPRTIGGAEMFPVTINGNHLADDGKVDLAPHWKFIGADGRCCLAQPGAPP